MKTSRSWLWSLIGVAALGLGWTATTSRAQKPAEVNLPAPEFTSGTWLNTPHNKPLTLASRAGKVTIVEFGCSNCKADLTAYAHVAQKFNQQDVALIDVRGPESKNDSDPKSLARRVRKLGLTTPVLLDARRENSNNWKQEYWPTVYLIDKKNRIRFKWLGDSEIQQAGGIAKLSQIVESLLQEEVTTTPAAMQEKGAKVTKIVKTDAEWQKELTPEQYRILRKKGTEAAFSGDYDNHEKGTYLCAGCGLELFTSDTKFDSGTGWPSFWQPIDGHVETETDNSFFMTRTEVLCARCGGHLGHVFDDGPKPTGLRYCMNAGAMRFEKQP